MKAKTKHYIIITISILMGLLLLWKIFSKIPLSQIITIYRQATRGPILLFVGISIVIMTLHALRWFIVVRSFGRRISFFKAFQLKIVGFGVSFITPAAKLGGEPVRAMMLQSEGFTFKRAITTIVIEKLIDISTTGILFIVGIIITIITIAIPKQMTLLIIIISFICLTTISIFYYYILHGKGLFVKIFRFLGLHKIKYVASFEKQIVEFENVLVKFYTEQRKYFNKAVFISVIAWFLMFVEFKSVTMMLGYNLSWQTLFIIITLVGFAYTIPIPLALGVLEAGQIAMFTTMGLKAAAGVTLAMTIRARDLCWTIIGLIILVIHGFSLRKVYNKAISKEGKLKVSKDDY